VPEVVEVGRTGFIVEDMESAVDAASRAHTLDRAEVRAAFDERFTAARMAREYLKLYRHVACEPEARAPERSSAA
jgi:hypothetical protein